MTPGAKETLQTWIVNGIMMVGVVGMGWFIDQKVIGDMTVDYPEPEVKTAPVYIPSSSYKPLDPALD